MTKMIFKWMEMDDLVISTKFSKWELGVPGISGLLGCYTQT